MGPDKMSVDEFMTTGLKELDNSIKARAHRTWHRRRLGRNTGAYGAMTLLVTKFFGKSLRWAGMNSPAMMSGCFVHNCFVLRKCANIYTQNFTFNEKCQRKGAACRWWLGARPQHSGSPQASTMQGAAALLERIGRAAWCGHLPCICVASTSPKFSRASARRPGSARTRLTSALPQFGWNAGEGGRGCRQGGGSAVSGCP